jgi:hypothetical protein
MDNIIYLCPHCNQCVIIETKDINCGIFRHGVYKDSGIQLDPHSSKDLCDEAVLKGLIYGCSKPFRIILKDNKYSIEICDYI